MKSLKIIQVLAKIAKIICKIIFVCCIVAFCGCVVGIFSLILGVEYLKIGGVSLGNILYTEASVSIGTLYTTMAIGVILSAGECVLAKFAEAYFTKEIADGTPFSVSGSKELFRLGILCIVISLGSLIIAEITQSVMSCVLTDVVRLNLEDYDSAFLGVSFLIFSLVFRSGAEILENSNLDNKYKDYNVDIFNDDKNEN